MATKATVQVLMPEMGESVTEGTVLEWLVAEGDSVEEGQTIVEVSTDKVDAEVPATSAGVITKIHVGPDETIEVGKPLADIDSNGEAAPAASGNGHAPGASPEPPSPSSPAPAPATASQPGTPGSEAEDVPADAEEAAAGGEAEAPSGEELNVDMPEMGESVTEGTVLEWHVAEGESIAEGETLVEVSTDKVDAEVPAPFSGTLTKIHVGPDETIEVGKPLATMLKGATPSASSASAPAPATASQPGTPGSEAEDVPVGGERRLLMAKPSNARTTETPKPRL